MSNYHVVTRFGEEWAVLRSGAVRASSLWPSEKSAWVEARRLTGVGEVTYLHGRDGRVKKRVVKER